MKFELSRQIFEKKCSNIKFQKKIRLVEAELFHVDGWMDGWMDGRTDRQRDGRTDMANLTLAFRNFANAPKSRSLRKKRDLNMLWTKCYLI